MQPNGVPAMPAMPTMPLPSFVAENFFPNPHRPYGLYPHGSNAAMPYFNPPHIQPGYAMPMQPNMNGMVPNQSFPMHQSIPMQRPTDPRLVRRQSIHVPPSEYQSQPPPPPNRPQQPPPMPPAPVSNRFQNQSTNRFQNPPMPNRAQLPPVQNRPEKLPPASAAKINARRITVSDYRRYNEDPNEREKDRVQQKKPEPVIEDRNHNELPIKDANNSINNPAQVNGNGRESPNLPPEPSFSPNELTPSDSPASTVAFGELSDHEDNSNGDVVNVAKEEITLKEEEINGEQMDVPNEADNDDDSYASDDTEPFDWTEVIAQHEQNANQNKPTESPNEVKPTIAEGNALFFYFLVISKSFSYSNN